MTAVKTLAIGVLFGIVSQSVVRGDSVSSTSWVFYGRGDAGDPGAGSFRRQYPNPYAPSSGPPTGGTTSDNAGNQANAAVAATSATTTPVSVSTPLISATSTATSTPSSADAYINLGTSAAPEASTLTTGGAIPWYDSPAVIKAYGGSIPSASQQSDFSNMVLNDVKQTFNEAGLNPSLTLNPNVATHHTLSVVSGTSYGANPNAIGITDVGNNGFSFIDKLNYASTPQELATAVSKNISHELMHAFGVGIHPDQTGTYIDTAVASWSLLTNPSSTFSPAAVALINKTDFDSKTGGTSGAQMIDGEQQIAAVPEPATWAIWTVGGLLGLIVQRRRTAEQS